MENTDERTESYSGSAGVRTRAQTEARTEVRINAQAERGDPNTFGQAAQGVTQEAKRRSQEVLGKVADEAQTFVGRVRGEATGALGEGKAQLASQIGGVARALRASGREFRGDSLTGLADLSEGLAGEVEAVENYLAERSGESLVADVRTFANRNRALFVGSLFVAGLVAVRFAQSTPPTTQGSAKQSSVRQGSVPRTGRSKTTVVTRGGVNTYRSGRS